jgi:pyruvate,water dikinase
MVSVAEPGITAADYRGFSAPGPGTWVLDASHVPRPLARFVAPMLEEQFRAGFGATFRRYGSMLETLEYRTLGGFAYAQPRPLGAPPDAVGHPPREVWDEILANSPEHQERLRTAEAVWAERRWRTDLEYWDTVDKPRLAAHRDRLDGVDLTALDDQALLTHLAECTAAYRAGWVTHHTYNAPALLPCGDYMIAGMQWAGATPAELSAALAGSSPVSTGGGPELRALAAAIAADPTAPALPTDGGDAAAAVAALTAHPGPVGTAMRAYLAVARFLPIDSEDAVGTPTTIESAELMLARIRSVVEHGEPDTAAVARAAAEALRARVPEEHLAEFDERLAEARLMDRLRDERAVHGDRAMGCVARRALLEVGRRLVDRGRLHRADHAVDLEAEEIPALLVDGTGPSADRVAAWVHWREHADYRQMPPLFGAPPGEPLPADWLPPAAARVHAALGFTLHGLLGDIGAGAAQSGPEVRGIPAGCGVAEGPARVLRTMDDLHRIEPGDVLVTTQTGPAFNLVLPLLAALVTDRGGVLSHAAIVARELGLPAVVGCATGTTLIQDGARVRVDATAGTVTVLAG